MCMEIRKASEKDFPSLDSLISEIFPSVQFIPAGRDVYFIASEEKEGAEILMGFAHVRLPKDNVEGKFVLQGLGVKNEYRLRGVGSALLESALSFCMEKGALEVQLSVRTLNPAMSLYHRFGFFPKKQLREDSIVLVRKAQT